MFQIKRHSQLQWLFCSWDVEVFSILSSFACTYLHVDWCGPLVVPGCFMYCMAHQVMAVVVKTHFCERTNGRPRHVYLVYFNPHNSESIFHFKEYSYTFVKFPLFTLQVCKGMQVSLSHWVYICLVWSCILASLFSMGKALRRGHHQNWVFTLRYCLMEFLNLVTALILEPYPTHYHRQQW